MEDTPKRRERIDALVHRQRHGEPDGSPWNGLYEGMSLVIGSDGHERLVIDRKDKAEADKSKDVQKPEEVTALLILGSPKTSTNKLSSEDEGLGEALHDLLNGEGSVNVMS